MTPDQLPNILSDMSGPEDGGKPTKQGSVRFKVQGLGDNDHLQYAKADAVKACRVGTNFAFSFYQIDYNALVNAASGVSKLKVDEIPPIPVAKVVMDPEAFSRFRIEFDSLIELLDKQQVIKK